MYAYLFIAFAIITAIQCIYYFAFIISSFSKNKRKASSEHAISVIVCAKNEANNLRQFLPSIFNQNYKNSFEVVLINDRSTDDTALVFEEFADQYSNIKLVNVQNCENFWGNKKYALTLGIKAASHEHLLFTDADCKPVSTHWISEMTSHFSDKKNIILGYGAYEKKKKSFLNKLIRFETLFTAIQYMSYAKLGNPYMGVGRNLAYTKTEFFKVNGFIKHIKVRSGDDDLFVNEVATKKNTIVSLTKESFTNSVAKKTYSEWIRQKRRHVSTANHYKIKDKLLLGLFYSSQFLFWTVGIVLLSLQIEPQFSSIIIAVRFLLFYSAIGLYSKKLDEKDLIIFAPITEITLIFIQFFIFLKNKIAKPKHW